MQTRFFILLLFYYSIGLAQFGDQTIISTEAAQPRCVFAADLDGDNDMDVLTASKGDDKVAWYENIDGYGNFGPQIVISQSLVFPTDISSADLDNDNDKDVIVAIRGVSQYESKVVWYENMDGLGSFSDYIIISELVQGTTSVFTADLDSDNDKDVLSASMTDNKIAWYENIDGLGTFGPQQIITNSAWSVRDVFAVDIDNDDDMDVVAPISTSDQVVWFENTNGLGNFDNIHIVSTSVNGGSAIHVADIDGDNDPDIISKSGADNDIYWHENSDGLGYFTTQHIITDHLLAVSDVFATDLDNDGDIDVLSASANDDYIVWYENLDGLGDFSTEQIISTYTDYPRSVFAADIDGDGDNDVLSASFVDSKIAWYENLHQIGIDENEVVRFRVYPNPTNSDLYIDSNGLIIHKIEIFDLLGRKVLVENKNFDQLNISGLNSGVLSVKIETESGVLVRKVIKN